AYSFQIYFDFSGYSDMAIGLGLMLGFRFPVNFNAPYRSTSITDFWRRWHISLSSWLRDYLYLPLGGNRKGSIRTYINLAVTMLLGGLWHGAAWTFIAWGAYQSFWLIVERLSGKDALYGRLPKPAKIAITFVLVQMGWVFFRAADLPSALSYFSMLFGFGQSSAVGPVLELRTLQVAVLIMAALIVWFVPTSQRLTTRQNPLFSLGLQPLFCLALLHLHYQDDVPFLYYQF
ncbi:MAG: MBOAT family O-acyltransferase, partial [Planctomycetota bacterium]